MRLIELGKWVMVVGCGEWCGRGGIITCILSCWWAGVASLNAIVAMSESDNPEGIGKGANDEGQE